METAPHDDSWVLVYCPDAEPPVTMGTYFRNDERDSRGRFKSGDWLFMEFDGLPSAGYMPTHWMPMPDEPHGSHYDR